MCDFVSKPKNYASRNYCLISQIILNFLDMVAIVDGGSSKCDWIVLQDNGREYLRAETAGFNPNAVAREFIATELRKNQPLMAAAGQLSHLFFYGSGCGSPHNRQLVSEELQKLFPLAEITVKEDLMAAAYAAYRGRPTIVCILGTGCNSCYFDGESVRKDVTSLGFLLGDEGSGCALGKHVLRRYFMKKLPTDLHDAFYERYRLTADDAIQQIYHNARVNAYLASFNAFVYDHRAHPYFQNMIFDELKSFLDFHVLPYPESRDAEVNFIGSVAFGYEKILHAAAAELNLTIGTIVQKPIESLVAYHQKYILG